jgi:crotonobetainyl-CoA:carnitine CoA-transferase CaiB-like acyl-CoA transferase
MIEGPLVFFAALITATVGILAALYSVARDGKPARGDSAARRVRFWNFR